MTVERLEENIRMIICPGKPCGRREMALKLEISRLNVESRRLLIVVWPVWGFS
jgi:hypothetical protein